MVDSPAFSNQFLFVALILPTSPLIANNNSECLLIIFYIWKELLSLFHTQSHLVLITTCEVGITVTVFYRWGNERVVRWTSLLKGIQLINARTTTNPGLSDSKIHALKHDPKLPIRSGLMIEKSNPSFIINASYVTRQNQMHGSCSFQVPSLWSSFFLA